MSFLNLWALGFAAIAPVIVLLYLLKVRRRPVTVSTVLFWERVLQENRRRALFQRLRNLLSLLLHLLIFALILFALVRPTLDRLIREGASTVIILDARARMQVVEPGESESRFARAVDLAEQYARQAGELRQIALLSSDAEPRIAASFTSDAKALRETLAALAPTDAGGDLNPAIRLAADLLASRAGERRIVVLTDRPTTSDFASLVAQGTSMDVISTAKPGRNVAITRFAARPIPSSPETSELLLEVSNFGDQPASAEVELALDSRVVDIRRFDLAPGEKASQVTSLLPASLGAADPAVARGWVTATLDSNDALAVDDVARATVPLPRKLRVLLVSEGNWFVEKVLGADTRLDYELLAPEAFTPALADQFAVVIFDRFVPAGWNWSTSEYNAFFLGKSPLSVDAAAIEQPVVSEAQESHPILRNVNVQNVTISKAAPLETPVAVPAEWHFETLLRSLEQPLMITGARQREGGQQRLAALAFDVGESDLPLRVAFPLLISNALQWLGQSGSGADLVAQKAGSVIHLEPEQQAAAQPRTVDTAARETPATSFVSGNFQPLHNGFYAIRTGEEEHWLAVNTFDAAESNTTEAMAPGDQHAPASVPAVWWRAPGGLPLWHYLALCALLLFTWEWWLFHRRQTE